MTENRKDGHGTVAGKPVSLAEHFAASPRFEELFSGGMALIEETAAYLDGEGRLEAKSLDSKAGALYGAESMRLTTRLMQLASWLLLQRAVAEGEMTAEHALTQKKTIKLNRLMARSQDSTWTALPAEFRTLADRANALQRRVMRLDAEIYGEQVEGNDPGPQNAVAAQQSLLQTAFDRQFER